MKIKTFTNAPVFSALQDIAVICQTGTKADIWHKVIEAKNDTLFASKGWQKALSHLLNVINYNEVKYSVIKKDGNSKLPFYAFSTLPGVTCPGAGDCLQYCYSYRAWRYPDAFARQFQNAFFMRFAPSRIVDSFRNIPNGSTFRLYVDGDFSSMNDFIFWRELLASNPTIKTYGYTKSFSLFLQADKAGLSMPSNYIANLSDGHNSDDKTAASFAALPVVRGAFKAVSIGHKVKSSDHGTKETNTALRKAYGKKAFTCPGKCGECTPKGHACGSDSFRGVDIIIAVH